MGCSYKPQDGVRQNQLRSKWLKDEKKAKDYHKSLEYLEKLLKIQPDAIHARALKKLLLQKYIV